MSGRPCTRAWRASGTRSRAVAETFSRGATRSPGLERSMSRVDAASGVPRPGQRYRIAMPSTFSSAIGMNPYSSRFPARRAARSKATSMGPNGSVNAPPRGTNSAPSSDARPPASAQLYRSAASRRRGSKRPGSVPGPFGEQERVGVDGGRQLVLGFGRGLPVEEGQLGEGEERRSGSPPVRRMVPCSSARASSGRASKASKSPCSWSTLRVAQLGSPVVTALRARSAWTTFASTRAALTVPPQAARARPNAARTTMRRCRVVFMGWPRELVGAPRQPSEPRSKRAYRTAGGRLDSPARMR